jgi:hypothetical protein
MITGANEYVQIQGPPPGDVVTPAVAPVTVQVVQAPPPRPHHWAMALGAVLIVGAGVAYAVHKR